MKFLNCIHQMRKSGHWPDSSQYGGGMGNWIFGNSGAPAGATLFALVPAVEIVAVITVEGVVVTDIFCYFFTTPLNYSDVAEKEASLWDEYKQVASINKAAEWADYR